MLHVCKSKNGIVFIAMYIDENLLLGIEAVFDEVIMLLQKQWFHLKIKGIIEDC